MRHFLFGLGAALVVLWAVWVSANIYRSSLVTGALVSLAIDHDQVLHPDRYEKKIQARPQPEAR
jgi:hypothetical protein